MTPSPHPAPDGHWLELLAAYVDGELDEPSRAKVERWLADHPEAKETLRTQRTFSPNNWRLWRQLEPQMPSEDAWAAACDAVAAGTERKPVAEPARRAGWVWVASGFAAAATAATLLLSSSTTPPAPPIAPEVVATDDPHAGVAVLPITTDADVDFLSVPGDAMKRLPVGTPQVSGKLALASADDVRTEDAEARMSPGDVPMIFASKP